MKKQIIILLCMAFSVSSGAVEVTWQGALNFVMNIAEANNSYDYYQAVSRTSSDNTDTWYVFVDREPTKEWEHSCALYAILKDRHAALPFPVFSKTEMSITPSEQYTLSPAYVHDRDFLNSAYEINLPVSSVTNPEAANTYAVIINSQKDPSSYMERSWNNCSLAYQTLVKKYRIPKSHILLFAPNGGTGVPVMQKADGTGLGVPSRDYDHDGIDDDVINLSDTDDWYLRYYLPDIVPQNAHVVIYITGAGGKDANGPYYYQWDNRKFYASDFDDYLDILSGRYFSIILDINHAADYQSYFDKDRTVVMAACGSDELATAMSDRPYNAFTYNVMNALINTSNYGINTNHDAYVSMSEAYAYAEGNVSGMTPAYHSQSHRIGEKLSPNWIEGTELFVRDVASDSGREPSPREGLLNVWWNSPDIFLRNDSDGVVNQEHENLDLSAPEKTAYLYVRVHNRGSKPFSGQGMYAHAYYANAFFGLLPTIYRGEDVAHSDDIPGDHLPFNYIKAIAPGQTNLVRFKWVVPAAFYYEGLKSNGTIDISYLTRLSDKMTDTFDFKTIDGKSVDVTSNNEIALKSIQKIHVDPTIHPIDSLPPINIFDNDPNAMFSYELMIDPDSPDITDYGKVVVQLSNSLYNSWQASGGNSVGVVQSTDNPRKLKMVSSSSKIQRLSVSSAVDSIRVSCEFNNNNVSQEETYLFHIVQRNQATGNIIGGAAFEVVRQPSAAYLQSRPENTGMEIISVLASSRGGITLQLSRPAECDYEVEAVCTDGSGKPVRGVVKEGESSVSLRRAGTGMNVIRLLKDGVVIDTAKINK